jgi:hypothetical protein
MIRKVTVAKEFLVWESNECTKEEWKFLCKIFGEDSLHTTVIKVTGYVVEAFTTEENSIFSEEV